MVGRPSYTHPMLVLRTDFQSSTFDPPCRKTLQECNGGSSMSRETTFLLALDSACAVSDVWLLNPSESNVTSCKQQLAPSSKNGLMSEPQNGVPNAQQKPEPTQRTSPVAGAGRWLFPAALQGIRQIAHNSITAWVAWTVGGWIANICKNAPQKLKKSSRKRTPFWGPKNGPQKGGRSIGFN